jgi:hypothetical protein
MKFAAYFYRVRLRSCNPLTRIAESVVRSCSNSIGFTPGLTETPGMGTSNRGSTLLSVLLN